MIRQPETRRSHDHAKCARAKVRDDQVTNRPFYVVIGVTVDGRRDILGIWAGEGAKFWLAVLTEIKNRGTADVCIAVCDGLTGLGEAITTVWASRASSSSRRVDVSSLIRRGLPPAH